MTDNFELVGIKPMPQKETVRKEKWYKGRPVFSGVLLALIAAGCLLGGLLMAEDSAALDLQNCSVPPNGEFLFGTDTMGRDIFSMIWLGGRVSLFIGASSAIISVITAIVFGALSGNAPMWADTILMRLTEILFSVPEPLLVIFIQAVLGEANVFSLSFVIGITGWMSMAKIIRTEVRQLRSSEYVIASRCMGGGFFHILGKHLAPNFISSVMFMAVMNIRNGIMVEATLSFMGIGLPVEVISWGSMLSLSEKALLSNAWWMIVIPGAFLVVTLMCITSLGNNLRKSINRGQGYF